MYNTMMTYSCYLIKKPWEMWYENCCLRNSRRYRRVFRKYNPDSAELSLSSCLVKTVIVSIVMWKIFNPFKTPKCSLKNPTWPRENLRLAYDRTWYACSIDPSLIRHHILANTSILHVNTVNKGVIYQTKTRLLVKGMLIPSWSSVMCRCIYTLNIVITFWKWDQSLKSPTLAYITPDMNLRKYY